MGSGRGAAHVRVERRGARRPDALVRRRAPRRHARPGLHRDGRPRPRGRGGAALPRPGRGAAVPAQGRAHVRGGARRAARGARRHPPHRLPAPGARPRQPLHHGEPGAGRVDRRLRHARAGHVRARHVVGRRRRLLQDGVLARRAARDVAARHRQRLRRPTSRPSSGTATTSPARSRAPASGSTRSTCCRPRSRSRRSCRHATSAT